jgi:hypothetical protein
MAGNALTLLAVIARQNAERDADKPDYSFDSPANLALGWTGPSIASYEAAVDVEWARGSVERARRRRDIKRRARRMLAACGPGLTPNGARLRAALRELKPGGRSSE